MGDNEDARLCSRTTAALKKFVSAVHETGGVVYDKNGMLEGCVADPEWYDVADAYLDGCHVLGITPKEDHSAQEAR